jgi:hypothetical protein
LSADDDKAVQVDRALSRAFRTHLPAISDQPPAVRDHGWRGTGRGRRHPMSPGRCHDGFPISEGSPWLAKLGEQAKGMQHFMILGDDDY